MSMSQIFLLLSGVALFLFGMTLMGDSLKKASGSKLEPILFRLSGTPMRGLLLGTGVTAVLQSSCATSVMAVGFVNSGMMKVRQSIGVILGSMLGTSVTGWIICLGYTGGTSGLGAILSSATITAVCAVAGIILRVYCKSSARRHIGEILLGFAILMLGMSVMSGAMESLGSQPWFTSILTSMTNPAAAILVGALFTAVLQSASAAVGILQALSVTGAITLESAFPLLLGVAIGASVPVMLSALGANPDGKRAALVYPIASVLGAAACAVFYFIARAVLRFSASDMVMDPFSLAWLNTLVRFILVCLVAPFTKPLGDLVTALVRGKETDTSTGPHLEDRFLAYPELALQQCGISVRAMADGAMQSFVKAVALLKEYSDDGMEEVRKLEETGDQYEDAISSYLLRLTGQELTEEQNRTSSSYLHMLTDLERISDLAKNIAESARELQEKQLFFSPDAQREVSVVTDAVTEVLRLTVEALRADDTASAYLVEPLEQVIDELCDRLQSHHVERLQQGRCSLMNGFILNDLATNLERVSDHCDNIAGAVLVLLGAIPPEATAPEDRRSPAYAEEYAAYSERFAI